MDVCKNNNKVLEKQRHTKAKELPYKLEERMNKTYWAIAFGLIIINYSIGFATNSALWVHFAFALALALSIVTLSKV